MPRQAVHFAGLSKWVKGFALSATTGRRDAELDGSGSLTTVVIKGGDSA